MCVWCCVVGVAVCSFYTHEVKSARTHAIERALVEPCQLTQVSCNSEEYKETLRKIRELEARSTSSKGKALREVTLLCLCVYYFLQIRSLQVVLRVIRSGI